MQDLQTRMPRDMERQSSDHEIRGKPAGDCLCDVSVKNLTIYCQCPANLREAEVKSYGLTCLAEVISRQDSI